MTTRKSRPRSAFYSGSEQFRRHPTSDGAIATVDHFMLADVYPLFDVPRQLPET